MMVQDPGVVQEEIAYMKEWVEQPVQLGFFVNPKGAGDADGNICFPYFRFLDIYFLLVLLKVCSLGQASI